VNLAEWKRRLGIVDFREVMAEIQRRRTSSNGVFGIKIHYPHIRQFGGFAQLVEFFPDVYFVLLSRKDVLKQAVSLSIANQTGVYISGQKPVNDDPKYIFSHIDQRLRQTILNNSSWRFKLAASGCKYIELDFEDVLHNLARSIEGIAGFMDIDIDRTEIPNEQVTAKQGDDRNSEWAARFTSDFNRSDELLSNEGPTLVKRILRRIGRMIHV